MHNLLWLTVRLVVAVFLLSGAAVATASRSSADPGVTEDTLALLRESLSTPHEASFHVSYDIEQEGESAQLAIFQKEGKQRLDLVFDTPDGEYFVRFFSSAPDDPPIFCVDEPGQEAQCVNVQDGLFEPGESFYWAMFGSRVEELFGILSETGQELSSVEARNIAGEDVQVYLFEALASEEGFTEIALTEDGIPLLLSVDLGSDNSPVHIEATEFSREVADNHFEPPASPI
ncbi:MAG: hypothetical protein HY675_10975 [Chloroflexi bacterium]|nr:hypothetical protein [Chloroflexota bacterium]